jgi:hypothetical protein
MKKKRKTTTCGSIGASLFLSVQEGRECGEQLNLQSSGQAEEHTS